MRDNQGAMLIKASLDRNEMQMHAGLSDTPAAWQIGSPEHKLRRLLALAGLPEPMAGEPVAGTRLGGREVAWRSFCARGAMGRRRGLATDFGSYSQKRRWGRWLWVKRATLGWGDSGAESDRLI